MTDALDLSGVRSVPWKDALPDGAEPQQVHFGRDTTGVGEVQIAVATVTSRPTKGQLTAMWATRGTKTAMPVVVAAVGAEGVWIYSNSTGQTPFGPLPHAQAAIRLQSILDEPDGIQATQRIRAIEQAYDTIGVAGFSNHFLFAAYHLQRDVPRRGDWAQNVERATPMLPRRGRALIGALGFTSDDAPGGALVLRSASGSRRAIAVLLDESEHFDQKSPRYQLSPVAHGLELAKREDVQWVIVLRQSTLRLYPGRDGVGVGQRGQSETYFELDLAFLDDEFSALLPLIFSAEALEKGGSTDQILDGSGRYAADLGTRLRDRVYLDVVPLLAVAVAERLPALGRSIDQDGLTLAYRLAMRILFRLLFQAYGEATELLPAGRNEHYDANSLQTFVNRELTTADDQFSDSASSIWLDLVQVWDAISQGNPRWEVPSYGGALFDPETEEGELLQKIQLPDGVLGPALRAMLIEVTGEGVPGPVDFRSLQVREFGTIYEGLLESSLSLAENDLAVDKRGVYVPAGNDDDVVIPAGQVYFHSTSGERKATGSYYTPKIVVDHLIERSVEPVLDAHLERVRELMQSGREREAASLFFDFRVADLAMGSAHFLVAAVDKIERGMRDFLTATPVPGVRAELQRLAETARAALGADTQAAEAITEAQLLRRQVARRCIYGLDINPLAVELSRLAIWIHTFVPGLPMSSLDHGLVLGNSLTGIGTIDEAIDALAVGELLAPLIREPLDAARGLLIDYANASEADKSEVAAGAVVLARAHMAAAPAKNVFDVAVAMRLGVVKPGSAFTQDDIDELAADAAVRESIAAITPAHMPYLFPEVFLRENPGFDALVGNPPWETVKVEEQKWWGLRMPGTRSLPQKERRAALEAVQESRPDLAYQYACERFRSEAYSKALRVGPFQLGAGDVDLYQVFAWRKWQLLRQGGLLAVVLPRTAMSGSPLEHWRREVIADGSFSDVCFLTNSGSWVFENVDGRYTVALVAVAKSSNPLVKFVGPFFSREEFLTGRGGLAEIPSSDFINWSKTCAFPLIPDRGSATAYRQMHKSPSFEQARPGWEFRLTNEVHSSNDRALFQFDVDAPRGRMPVFGGASFNLWEPEAGMPFAYADEERLRKHLSVKLASQQRLSRSAYHGMHVTEGLLPLDQPRIAFRKITNPTNQRTTITALIPSGVSMTEAGQLIVRVQGDAKAEAFLLGVLSSIPFDWSARRWVELNFNFFIMQSMPMPIYVEASNVCARVVSIAGALAAVDERYAAWAEEVGVEVGSISSVDARTDLVAELDALVSILYGLSTQQVERVFATFHRGWKYDERLAAVLEHYENWKNAS